MASPFSWPVLVPYALRAPAPVNLGVRFFPRNNEVNVPTQIFDDALCSHSFRPTGIKVSTDLWRELNRQGRIKWQRGFLEGIIDSGIDLPVLGDDIFIHLDPDLDNFDFTFPSKK
jgi:hypothetical protein